MQAYPEKKSLADEELPVFLTFSGKKHSDDLGNGCNTEREM
jgi:hypothetical protein